MNLRKLYNEQNIGAHLQAETNRILESYTRDGELRTVAQALIDYVRNYSDRDAFFNTITCLQQHGKGVRLDDHAIRIWLR